MSSSQSRPRMLIAIGLVLVVLALAFVQVRRTGNQKSRDVYQYSQIGYYTFYTEPGGKVQFQCKRGHVSYSVNQTTKKGERTLKTGTIPFTTYRAAWGVIDALDLDDVAIEAATVQAMGDDSRKEPTYQLTLSRQVGKGMGAVPGLWHPRPDEKVSSIILRYMAAVHVINVLAAIPDDWFKTGKVNPRSNFVYEQR